jgi:hypothetical protein
MRKMCGDVYGSLEIILACIIVCVVVIKKEKEKENAV